MKIAVPLQTPKFGLDQGVSRAEEMVVNLSSIPDLKVNNIFNTALSWMIRGLVLILYLSLMRNWKYDHVIAKAVD